MGGITPTKPGSASLPFFGIEPAIIDPVSGEEISGNDVEGVLAFKQPWPSMARTVWGAHKRYMDTYLNVYKGYYVRKYSSHSEKLWLTGGSSLEMAPVVITMDTIGSAAVLTTWSTYPATGCPPLRLKLLCLNTVSSRKKTKPETPEADIP